MSFKSEMYKWSEKKPLVDGKDGKEAVMDGNQHTNRASISLTDALKNDSDLCPAHDRRSSNSSDTPRICRCAQRKLFQEKTKEKIRLSQESNRSSEHLRGTPAGRRMTKEEVYAEIFDNDITADCLTNNLSPKGSSMLPRSPSQRHIRISNFPEKLYGAGDVPILEVIDDIEEFHKKEQDRIKARISTKEVRYTEIFDNDVHGFAVPVAACNKPLDGRTCQRLSKERRYTEIFGNDVNGCAFDDSENVEIEEHGTKRSSKEQRYTQIFDNDILGYLEESPEFLSRPSQHQMDGNNSAVSLSKASRASKEEMIQNVRFGNSEDSQRIDGSYRSSKEHRYTQIFGNDINGYVEPQNIMCISIGSRSHPEATQPQRSSKEKRYTAIFDNDMFGFVDEITTTASAAAAARKYDESYPNIGQKSTEHSLASRKFSDIFEDDETMTGQNKEHLERPSISMNYKMCTESCTSHLKPHRCSIKVASCTKNPSYEADDEGSSTNLDISSKSQSLKHDDHPRKCACSKRFPELFNKELSK